MFVSVTRLRLTSWRHLIPFIRRSSASIRQALAAEGFVCGSTLIDRKLTFWTLTVWDSETNMRAYRGVGPHREAMPYLRRWCAEAATTNWTQTDPQRPAWTEAFERLRTAPRWHTVDHPGPEHLSKEIRPPSLARWRDQPMR